MAVNPTLTNYPLREKGTLAPPRNFVGIPASWGRLGHRLPRHIVGPPGTVARVLAANLFSLNVLEATPSLTADLVHCLQKHRLRGEKGWSKCSVSCGATQAATAL